MGLENYLATNELIARARLQQRKIAELESDRKKLIAFVRRMMSVFPSQRYQCEQILGEVGEKVL